MTNSQKTLEIKIERFIPAPAGKVYDSWLNPKIKGNPWNMADKLILNPKVNGFFYWLVHGTPHYGRFTKIERARRIQHTWVSPYTQGHETMVTITFQKNKEGTLMRLIHSDLPNNPGGRAHKEGWNQFMDNFPKHFKNARRKK